MPPRMVISVDGLNARFLGAYGNSWVPTPTIDSLAAKGLLFDQYYAEHGCPQALLWSQLSGKHPAIADSIEPNSKSCSALDQQTLLVTDVSEIPAEVSSVFSDQLRIQVKETPVATESTESDGDFESEEVAACGLELLFESAFATIENLQLWNRESLVWVHCNGMYGKWDAPLEFQELFKGEEDPEPIETSLAPAEILTPDHDPDERVRWQHAYAAQVMQLDQVLGDFLDVVWDKQPAMAVTFCGLRGFALGEHLEIGELCAALHVERTHVPLIHVDHRAAPIRVASQFGTHSFRDLFWREDYQDSLRELLENDRVSSDGPAVLMALHNSQARIQTVGWSYLQELVQEHAVDQVGKLFRRPDDRLESNNVAGLCPEVVKELSVELERRLLCYQEGKTPTMAELSEQAIYGIE